MKKIFAILSLFLVICVSGGVLTAATNVTTVQNGLNNYAGQTNDAINWGGWGTWVDEDPNDSDPGHPTGPCYDEPGFGIWTGADDIDMVSSSYAGFPDEQPHYHQRCLIRFANLQDALPAGEYVHSVTLVLSDYWQHDFGASAPVSVFISRAMQPWTDGDTYWTNWGDGGRDSGYTGISLYSGVMDPNWQTNPPATLEFELDPLVVQDWVDDPCNNYGMLLYHNVGSYWSHWTAAGQDAADPCKAPKLIIETSDTPLTDPCVPDNEIQTEFQNGVNEYSSQVNDMLSYGGWGYDNNGTPEDPCDDTISLAGYDSPGTGIWTGGTDDVEMAHSPFVFPDGEAHYHQRNLIKFGNIEQSIPAGVTITSATLTLSNVWLYTTDATGAFLNVDEALQPWTPGAVYWTNWGDGGRDPGYLGVRMASMYFSNPIIGANINEPLVFELDPSVVQGWIEDPLSNHGMLISHPVGVGYTSHWGTDGEDGSIPPKLTVTYILEGDLNSDLKVNELDLAIFNGNWLECTDPEPPCNYVP